MAEAQRPFLIGALAGLVIVAVAAPVVAMLWKHAAADRQQIQATLAEVDSRLDKTNAALEDMRKAASLAGVTKQLDELNARIKSTNEALAGVQKASLDNIRDRLDRVEAGIKSGNTALTSLQKGLAPDGLSKQLGQLAANLTALETSLASLKQATPAPGAAATTSNAGDMAGVLDQIKKGVDDSAASGGKVLAAVTGLQQALKSAPASPAAAVTDLVVVHVASPGAGSVQAGAAAQAAAPMAPLSVHFQKIGGTDETAQTIAIVDKVKEIVKGRKGCAISVAGYADTLGDDDINLAVSKDRAHVIATKLKDALGGDVSIAETAWGERRLQEMTKDNVASKANRRVDIAVQCKS